MTLKWSVFEGRNTDFLISFKVEFSFSPMLQNTWILSVAKIITEKQYYDYAK